MHPITNPSEDDLLTHHKPSMELQTFTLKKVQDLVYKEATISCPVLVQNLRLIYSRMTLQIGVIMGKHFSILINDLDLF